jgi:hypothetical protein
MLGTKRLLSELSLNSSHPRHQALLLKPLQPHTVGLGLRPLIPYLVQARDPPIAQSGNPFIQPQHRALGIAEVPTLALVYLSGFLWRGDRRRSPACLVCSPVNGVPCHRTSFKSSRAPRSANRRAPRLRGRRRSLMEWGCVGMSSGRVVPVKIFARVQQ